MNGVRVSVICLVYNHEKYLRACLDGFVMQECDFEYEVLIHDDASTDASASIIREYEEKYPNIIKPIYQKENQYSRGTPISKTYLFPRAKGEYLAWCEGDDCWTDKSKLQMQVDFLDKNPTYAACVHSAEYNDLANKRITVRPSITESREYTVEEIIKKGGDIFSTNSLMMRKSIRMSMPDCFKAKGFGDYQLFIYSAISGGVWCISKCMSSYNYGTSGSWSSRVWNDVKKRVEHQNEVIRMLKSVDCYYEYKYTQAISYKISETEFQSLVLTKDKKGMKNPKYSEFYKKYKKGSIRRFLARIPLLRRIKRALIK